MHSQTLQTLRGEIEAVATLQLALNRVALFVEDDSLSVWDGPRPEDVDDVADDDGSFSREAVLELRTKAGDAIARRYKEVERILDGKPALEAVVRGVLSTGTGGVISAETANPGETLGTLARSGALSLDHAQEAAAHVREALDGKVKPKAKAKPKAKGKATTPGKAKVPVAAKAKAKSKATKKMPTKLAAVKKTVKKAVKKKVTALRKRPAVKKKK